MVYNKVFSASDSSFDKTKRDTCNNVVRKVKSDEINFPNKNRIELYLSIVTALFCVLLFYSLFGSSFLRPLDYIEPCDGSDVVTLKSFNDTKAEISRIEEEMKAITIVAAYNISIPYKSSLLEKHTNLSNISSTLTKQLKGQRELRYQCYVDNLYPACCQTPYLIVCIYILAAIYLMRLSSYYISEAYKCKLTPEQLTPCKDLYNTVSCFWISHAVLIISAVYFAFKCKPDQIILDRFPL